MFFDLFQKPQYKLHYYEPTKYEEADEYLINTVIDCFVLVPDYLQAINIGGDPYNQILCVHYFFMIPYEYDKYYELLLYFNFLTLTTRIVMYYTEPQRQFQETHLSLGFGISNQFVKIPSHPTYIKSSFASDMYPHPLNNIYDAITKLYQRNNSKIYGLNEFFDQEQYFLRYKNLERLFQLSTGV